MQESNVIREIAIPHCVPEFRDSLLLLTVWLQQSAKHIFNHFNPVPT